MTKGKVFLLLQALLCIAVAVLLTFSAVGIYREGIAAKAENPLAWIYSREIVAERFKVITPLFFISVGLTIAGLILEVRDENSGKPVKDPELARDFTVSRVAQANEGMQKEQTVQKRISLFGWAGFGVCMVPVLLYITNGEHFPNGNLEPVFLSLLMHTVPWIAAGFGCLMVAAVCKEKSILRETEFAREQLKAEKAAGIQKADGEKQKKKDYTGTIRLVLLAAAVCFIIAGVFNGSARDVLGKAVKICTECVGLG